MRWSASKSLSLVLLALGPAGAAAAEPALPTYTAVYRVQYNGRDAGTSEFSVSYDAAREVYTFRSRTTVKGLMLRLASPNPIVEHSEFVVRGGHIQPLVFRYEDGSRKAEDNFRAVFDWEAGTALIEGSARAEIDLVPGVLDRGSMQVAVMRDMAAGKLPGPYLLADEDSLKTYEYTLLGGEHLQTPLGELATLRYRQQRQGSSRSLALWAAPALQYLPARIEQRRGDETRAVFILESVQGL